MAQHPSAHAVLNHAGLVVHATHIGFLAIEGVHMGVNLVTYGGFTVLSLAFLLLVRETIIGRKEKRNGSSDVQMH